MAKECPRCGLVNVDDAIECDCGSRFDEIHRDNSDPPGFALLWILTALGLSALAATAVLIANVIVLIVGGAAIFALSIAYAFSRK